MNALPPSLRLKTLLLLCAAAWPVSQAAAETQLPAVEVRGSRVPTPGKSEISAADIERQQATSVPQLLDTLPGVDLSGSMRPGGQSLNIWGFGAVEDVKVILDGAPKGFEKYRQGSVFIEPELIRRIEVDKGPHSSLYSNNGGFGGTVRIETKDAADLLMPGESFGALLKSGYHSNDKETSGSASVYGASNDRRFDILASGTLRRSGNLRRTNGQEYRYSRNHNDAALLKTSWRQGDSRFTLSLIENRGEGWSPFDAKRGEIPTPTDAEIARYGEDEAWRRKVLWRDTDDSTLSATWRYAPVDRPWLNLTVRWTDARTRQHDKRPDSVTAGFPSTGGNESWTTYRDRQAEIINEAAFATGELNHVLTTGVQWHDNRRDTMMFTKQYATSANHHYGWMQPYYMPSGRQETLGGFVQESLTRGATTLTGAARFDQVTTHGVPNLAPAYNNPAGGHDYRPTRHSGWSPRLGAIWRATSRLSFYADVSKTWRAPLIDETYEVQSAGTSAPATSRSLKKERITAWRAGLLVSADSVLSESDRLSFAATLFRNDVHNNIEKRFGVMVEPGSAKPPRLSFYRNLPGYRTEGVELESSWDSRSAFAGISLSWMRGKHHGTIRNPWGQDAPVMDVAPAKMLATLGAKWPVYGLSAGWQGRFVAAQDEVPGNVEDAAAYQYPKSKGYALHGLFAQWQGRGALKRYAAGLAIDNLFNRDYTPYLAEGVYAPGRNIKLSLSVRL
ncbi:TonB-dependent hemoglobin/transferrin/lactoferrin family receptor [Paludibacterium paludis]|uniref:TonB-dependent receptor n=1 Tax=Paludibacterium paludis TaxID=1225769 RepID=A0A918UB65_9NEIS|nr:TonB-dependent hemoglobin/transferrin/lactoferrin family receptor [Paludibacterium paludis]GGY22470.1 TonB-dependent receptor [Paludibacterium paludis]